MSHHHHLIVPLLLSAAAAAQSSRTTMEVTPQGVFPLTVQGPPSLLAGNPNPSPSGLRWTYRNLPGLPWITEFVSAGNSGTWAWLGQNLNGQRLSLASTTDNPGGAAPATIFEVLKPGVSVVVRAADKGPACAVLTRTNSNTSAVEYFTGFSTTPLFTINLAFGVEVAISDEGRFIAIGYSVGTNASQVDVHDAQSGTPLVPIATLTATSHSFRHHDISGDGSRVLIATNTRDHVFDVGTQTELFSASTVSHDAHSLSYDGRVMARGGFAPIAAYRDTGSGWTQLVSFTEPALGFPVWTASDVSGDGTTFVAAAYDANNNSRFRVHCFSLVTTPGTLLWTYANDGSGTLQDTPSAVSVSDNGRWIAVGSWGAQSGGHPEALLFDRDAGNVPVGSVDTPGSVFDLDISGDGQFLVVGTKSVHANNFGNGGEGYSFDRGGQGHRLYGTSSIGRNIRLDTGGTPGEAVLLLLARFLGNPIAIPGINGTLDLDPLSLIGAPIFVGTVPPAGVLTTPLTVPADPALIGAAIFTQTLRVGAVLEFDNALRLPFTQ
jgi:hypothetical protein